MRLSQEYFFNIELFTGLSPVSMQKLAAASKINFYKKNAFVFNSNASEKVFMYIINGWLKIFSETADGTEIVTDVLNNKNYFGEYFLFNNYKKSFRAQAISDLTLLEIPIPLLKQMIDEDHQLALNLLKSISTKNVELSHEIEHLNVQTAMERIGCYLLRLPSYMQKDKVYIKIPYDKSLVAAKLGMRPETFSRAFLKLCQQYDIIVEDNKLWLPSINRLTSFICDRTCSQKFPCIEHEPTANEATKDSKDPKDSTTI